jgi:hypothetical protein
VACVGSERQIRFHRTNEMCICELGVYRIILQRQTIGFICYLFYVCVIENKEVTKRRMVKPGVTKDVKTRILGG